MPVKFPPWLEQYIGLPFEEHGRDRAGIDCWGLVRLVLAEQAGLELPSFADGYATTEDAKAISALIRGEMGPWLEIAMGPDCVLARKERLLDGVLIRMKGQPMHCALVVADGWMLHIERGVNSSLARYRGLEWKDRIVGFYRHRGLEAAHG